MGKPQGHGSGRFAVSTAKGGRVDGACVRRFPCRAEGPAGVEHLGGTRLPSWGALTRGALGSGAAERTRLIVRVFAPIAITKYRKPGRLSTTELSHSSEGWDWGSSTVGVRRELSCRLQTAHVWLRWWQKEPARSGLCFSGNPIRGLHPVTKAPPRPHLLTS